MKKLAKVLIGVSGSGKSTHVRCILNKDNTFKVVSKDLIRKELFEYDTEKNFWDQYSFKEEKKLNINSIMMEQIKNFANLDQNIIIDNTNLSINKNDSLKIHLESLGYEVEFINLNAGSNINYYLQRNSNRLDSISDGAVNDQFILASQSGYIEYKAKYKIAIVDLDGTVALKGDRTFFEYNKAINDTPNTYVIDTIKAILDAGLIDYVQFLSGRESYSYTVTKDWLKKQGFDMNRHRLLLRKTKDHRKDIVIKKEIYDACLSHNEVFAVFDDRPQVIDLWWDLKLPVFHVGDYRINF